MIRHLLFAFAILFLSAAAIAQTSISGNITQNTTWTKAGSPYVLTGNVGIPSAYTLTIEPGVEVQRSADYRIFSYGAIRCVGTEADSIRFTSTGLDNTSKFFIEFQRSNLGQSSFRYISTSGSSSNFLRLGYDGNPSNPQNTDILLVSRSTLSGVYMRTSGDNSGAVLTIDSSALYSINLENEGMFAEGIYFFNSQLYDSHLQNVSYRYGIGFTNCYLNNTHLANYGKLLVTASTLENSWEGNANGSFDSLITANSTFINTLVYGDYTAVVATSSSFTTSKSLYNDISGAIAGYLLSAGTLSMRNCTLSASGTAADSMSGVSVASSYVFDPALADTIVHNRFDNFYDAVTVKNYPNNIRLDSNDFFNPGRYAIVNYGPKDFSALYDYFQLSNGQTIDDLIFDQNDDLTYGRVLYTPYAGSPNTGALPVTLTRFTGSKEGNTIKLSWQTSDDLNVYAFVVQKKAGNDFVDVGTVTALGANGGNSYSFTDVSPLTGTNEYRLKITEKDGKNAYSNVVPVDYGNLVKTLRVYPNPASAYIVIEYAAAGAGTQLQLTDAGGRLIKTMVAAAGSTQTKMNVGDVARGTYRLVVKDGSKTESRTVLIQ